MPYRAAIGDDALIDQDPYMNFDVPKTLTVISLPGR